MQSDFTELPTFSVSPFFHRKQRLASKNLYEDIRERGCILSQLFNLYHILGIHEGKAVLLKEIEKNIDYLI